MATRARLELGCALGSPRRRSELIQPPVTWSFPALSEEISLGTELPFPEMGRCCFLCSRTGGVCVCVCVCACVCAALMQALVRGNLIRRVSSALWLKHAPLPNICPPAASQRTGRRAGREGPPAEPGLPLPRRGGICLHKRFPQKRTTRVVARGGRGFWWLKRVRISSSQWISPGEVLYRILTTDQKTGACLKLLKEEILRVLIRRKKLTTTCGDRFQLDSLW